MVLKCVFVLVYLAVHCSFALQCKNVFTMNTATCDECIRCGGVWCKDPNEEKHCKNRMDLNDGWCPTEQENKNWSVEPNSIQGEYFDIRYQKKLAQVKMETIITLGIIRPIGGTKGGGGPKPYFKITNSTQSAGLPMVHLKLSKNTLDVTTKIPDDFCSATSTKFEYVYIEVGISGVPEKVTLQYQVPCACDCSERREVNSTTCNSFGTFTCGSCQCNEGRVGKFCEKKHCPSRGDDEAHTSCSIDTKPCFGNGYCDECDECQCINDTSIQGSQYYHQDTDCIDLCSAINNCDDCLINNQPGLCEFCEIGNVMFHNLTVSWLEQQFDSYRKTWVNCSVNLPNCGLVKYAATEIMSEKKVMILKHCDSSSAGIVAANNGVTIPVIIAVIAAIAAMVAAAAGYVAWKDKGALPTTGSNYANIGPEDSVSENPLYKPPTSSFKNPMFGKA